MPDLASVLEQARVPEHSAPFMQAMSQGTAFLEGEYLFLTADDWLMAIGYPLSGEYAHDSFERALAAACEQTGAVVEEYSVAPCFMGLNTRGAHEWVLEFSERPDTPEHFAEVLDRELRSVNSDYDAKRQTALDPPRIHAVPPGTTLRWLQKTGKNKLPRMRNDRTVVEQLLKIEQ